MPREGFLRSKRVEKGVVVRLLICAELMFGVLLAPSGWVMAEAALVSVNMSENSVLAPDETLALEGFGVADNDHRAPFHLDIFFDLAMRFLALVIAIGGASRQIKIESTGGRGVGASGVDFE